MAEHWSGDYQPLRIIAHLAGPVALLPHEGCLPLDGLLEYAACRLGWPSVLQYQRPEGANISRPLPKLTSRTPANFVLPIKRQGHKLDPEWFWSASWGSFPQGYELDRQFWNKRFDGCDPDLGDHLTFEGRRGSVSLASGRYKSYHMPLALVVASVIQWCALGAADGVATLLREITHLGHKRSQGFGEVARWEVWTARHDFSCWTHDQRPARSLPEWFVTQSQRDFGSMNPRPHALRAPHWHASRRKTCVVPDGMMPGME